jgi:hypothetical protein
MKFSTLGALLFAAALSTGCASGHKLKNPCSLSVFSSAFASEDCGPLRPVNEAIFHFFNF